MRSVGRAFVDQRRGAVDKWPVDDVRVTRDPADVSGAKVGIVVAQVEHVLHRVGDLGAVAAGTVNHALGLARGARGVQDEQRVLRVDHRRWKVAGLMRQELAPHAVAAWSHCHLLARALHHHHVPHARAVLQSLVDMRLERHHFAAPIATIRGQHQRRPRVQDPIPDRIRREAAKDHRVRCPQARARQHRNHQLGHHRHVQDHAIPGDDTQAM